MPTLTLRVLAGDGTEHVYTSAPRDGGGAGLLAGENVVTERATAAGIELSDLPLELAGPFLGASTRDDLPVPSIPPATGRGMGSYRAELSAGARVVLDGAIPHVDAAHDITPDTWAVTLLAAAQSDAWSRLEEVRLDALSEDAYASIATVGLDFLFRDTRFVPGGDRWITDSRFPLYSPFTFGPSIGNPTARRLVAYELRSLVRAVFETAGIALDGDLPEPTYRVRYWHQPAPGESYEIREITRPMVHHVWSLGSWKTGAISRTNPTLPTWTGARLVEAALATYGWRLAASYAPFPSADVVIRVLADDPPPPSTDGLADVGPRLAAGGYTRVGALDSATGTAVRHEGPLRATALPSSVPDSFRDEGTVGVQLPADGGGAYGIGALPVPAPAMAVLAQDRWTFGPTPPGRDAGDPEPEAADVVMTGWALPAVGSPRPLVVLPVWPPTAGSCAADAPMPDPAHPGYRERLVYGLPCLDPADDAAYLGVVVDVPAVGSCADGAGGTKRLLFARDPAATFGVPDDQPQIINEAWAAPLYELRGRSLAPREVADGAWYVHDLDVRAGDPSQGVALEGRAWVVSELARRLSDDRADITAERPAGPPIRPERPRRAGAVADLRARYQHIQIETPGSPANQQIIIAEWLPPPVALGADWYTVGVRRAATSSSSAGAWLEVDTYATAVVLTPSPAPAPGQTWEVRVRTTYGGASGGLVTISFTIPEED